MKNRRHTLLRILNDFRVARNDYLHDGRQTVFDAEGYLNQIESLFAPTLFQQVMTASKTYVERFGGELGYVGVFLKVEEEHREYLEAISEIVQGQPTSFILIKPETLRQAAAEELIDCLVTLGGMASYAGLTWDEIEIAAREKLAKLDARTTDDYAWNGKTVERIGKKVQS